MGLKAKDVQTRLAEIREENKDNPKYPKLTKIDNQLEVIIDGKIYQGTPEEMLNKFQSTPYFTEEYEDIMQNQDAFITYNMEWIEKELKSKYDS